MAEAEGPQSSEKPPIEANPRSTPEPASPKTTIPPQTQGGLLAPPNEKLLPIPLQPSLSTQSVPRRARKSLLSRIGNFIYLGRSRSGSTASSLQGIDRSIAVDGAITGNGEGGEGASAQKPLTKEERAARIAENKESKRYVRSIPAWIHSVEEGELDSISPATALIPRKPAATEPAQHVFAPEISREKYHTRDYQIGRQEDGTPLMVNGPVSRWLPFMRSTEYPRRASQEGEIVDEDWQKENLPNLDEPWELEPDSERDKDRTFWLFSRKKRDQVGTRMQRILMRNPFIPLIIRITVLTFCLAALGLGATIYDGTSKLNNTHTSRSNSAATNSSMDTGNDNGQPVNDYICKQQTSTYMAFIVDTFAVIYLAYITWDEYFSKPLGLRRSRDKMRLLFLDLLFIVFSAGNLSLGFNTLTDQQWACYRGNPNDLNFNNDQAARSLCIHDSDLCARQKALCSVLLLAEIAWVMTFSISTLRVVERVSR